LWVGLPSLAATQRLLAASTMAALAFFLLRAALGQALMEDAWR